MRAARSRSGVWSVAAASTPLIALAAAISFSLGSAGWRDLSGPVIRSLMPDAFLYSSWVLVAGAPLLGVVRGSQPRMLAGAVALFVTASAMIHVGVFGAEAHTLALVATSHATVAAVATALVAWGALCAGLFRDRLDAAGAALTTALLLSGGVLLAGAPVADAPRAVVEAVLTASPVVAMAATAGIDLARTEVVYQLSPLARLNFDYPTWYAASAWYLGAAGVLSAAAWRMRRTIDSCPHLKGMPCPFCRGF